MQSVLQCLATQSQNTAMLLSGVLLSWKDILFSLPPLHRWLTTSAPLLTVGARWIESSMQETFEELAKLSRRGTEQAVGLFPALSTDATRSTICA